MDGLGLGETAWAGWDDVVLVGAVKNWRRRRVRQVERSGSPQQHTWDGWDTPEQAEEGRQTTKIFCSVEKNKNKRIKARASMETKHKNEISISSLDFFF